MRTVKSSNKADTTFTIVEADESCDGQKHVTTNTRLRRYPDWSIHHNHTSDKYWASCNTGPGISPGYDTWAEALNFVRNDGTMD